MAQQITWSADQTAAYLLDDRGNIVGRWFQNRPEMSTFDPFSYQYGQGYGYQAPGQNQSYMYQAWQQPTTTTGGYYYPPEKTELDYKFDELDLDYADREAVRKENARQFDEKLALDREKLKQDAAIAQAQIAAGDRDAEMRLQGIMAQIASNERIAAMDNASREKIADAELAQRLKEMLSAERIQAAQTWANPIDYLAYNRWLAGQPAMTTESGLPVGAPGWETGQPEQATVGTGAVATGGADVYGQQLAAGNRIQEFGAWGGPTTPVEGTPWVAPHQTNIAQFANTPEQAQQTAYARWRQRGITPETAYQQMYAAAPVGTAASVVGYG